jgi:methionyl-tRNA formyltransferase
MSLRVVLCGSRYFGASMLDRLLKEPGVDLTGVIVPAVDDRLATQAQAAGLLVRVQDNPKLVPGSDMPGACDLIVAAHTHARIGDDALALARLGGIGYHPSLLPRHRGIAAVEWTILAGDPIAGGSVYHLADGWDAGPVAAQDWCFVARDDTARTLWERELAPMGLRLLIDVVRHARDHGSLPSKVQDPRFATRAPRVRWSATLDAQAPQARRSLVVSVMGPDRPGIVSLLADRAQRLGASWKHSYMANLAGEFAGIVELDVAPEGLDALAQTLQSLESSGLRVAVARGPGHASLATRPASIELSGEDRVGLLHELTSALAERGVGIDQLSTDIEPGPGEGSRRFRVRARLQVPESVPLESLHQALDALASRLKVDIDLG